MLRHARQQRRTDACLLRLWTSRGESETGSWRVDQRGSNILDRRTGKDDCRQHNSRCEDPCSPLLRTQPETERASNLAIENGARSVAVSPLTASSAIA